MSDEEDVPSDSTESGSEHEAESISLSVDDERSTRRAKKIAWMSENLQKREHKARTKRVCTNLKRHKTMLKLVFLFLTKTKDTYASRSVNTDCQINFVI